MERKDTQALLNIEVPEYETDRTINESLATDFPLEEDNGNNLDLYKELRDGLMQEPDLKYSIDLEDLTRNQLQYVPEDSDVIQKFKESEQFSYQERLEEIKILERQNKARLRDRFWRRKYYMKYLEKIASDESSLRKKKIGERFKSATKQLKDVIKLRKNETKHRIGKLNEATDKEMKRWDKTERKLYVRLELCRAIKDKLPCAYFVMLVTLWDRLGGTKVELSKEKRITKAKRHGGRYFHNCLRIEETLEIKVPPAKDLKPSMVLSFELFILRNRMLKYDKPVAYGYFPLCNSDFQISEGLFKTPMMKGEIDLKCEKFSDLEERYKYDIETWMCNLYFSMKLDFEPEGIQLKYPEQFEDYQFSVTGPDGLKSRWQGSRRLKYIFTEVFQDLGFRVGKLKYAQIWITLLILAFALWIDRLTHYFGQYLFLKMSSIEITKYTVLWITFDLETASDLKFGSIVGYLFAGSLFSIFVFGLFSLLAFLVYWYEGYFPALGFRIGVLFGLCMVLDPIITIIESIGLSLGQDDWSHDPFLLSIYFQDREDSGFFGPCITFLIYVALSSACAFLFYNYLLYVHMNGRMLDTYHRLTSLESDFLVPYDSEVSEKYLRWVISKAHKYRTLNGDIRKVAVAEYFERTTNQSYSHIAIYNEGKGRSLYRHFMRLPVGAICELSTNRLRVFDDEEQ